MGLNGHQLFVRHDDPGAVEAAIREYVGEYGAEAVLDPDKDVAFSRLAAGADRTFALAPPVEGTIAVWEDGAWSDRRMAQYLSKTLGTEAVWLMLSDITDSWAYARYERGEETGRAHEQPPDLYAAAERFAERERLPYAFEYLPEARESPVHEEVRRRLAAEGFYDVRPRDVEGPPEAADEPPAPPESGPDRLRDDLITFTVKP